jgi:hypothetical protein
MRLDKKHTVLKKMNPQDNDNYVDASPEQRMHMVWELTQELWSLKDPACVEQRLQRHVTKLYRP